MKTIILMIFFAVSFTSCQSDETKMSGIAGDTNNYTTIKWIDSVKNIGTVNAGTTTEIKFRFKNTGEKPLYIIAARPGCGCTVADYPKEAIAAGAEGVITANYDIHKGTEGEFRKNISVTANTKGSKDYNIFFYGQIKKESDANGATVRK